MCSFGGEEGSEFLLVFVGGGLFPRRKSRSFIYIVGGGLLNFEIMHVCVRSVIA